MLDTEKTKEQLLDELAQLRQRVQALDQREEQRQQQEQIVHHQLLQEQTRQWQIEQSVQTVAQELYAVQNRQHFLVKLLEMSPGLLYLFDVIEQRTIYINGRSRDLLGFAPEVILAMGANFMAQQLHPDDYAQFFVHLEQLATAADGSFQEMEYRIRHANGEWRWFSRRDTVFNRTAAGRVHQILGMAQDITARKLTEVSRQESHELFQSFMHHSPIAAFIKDEVGHYLYANPRLEEMFQRSQVDLIGKTDFELLPTATAEQYRTNDVAVLSRWAGLIVR